MSHESSETVGEFSLPGSHQVAAGWLADAPKRQMTDLEKKLTAEIEKLQAILDGVYVGTLQAQTDMFNAMGGAAAQMDNWIDENRARDDTAGGSATLEERRRWHALACLSNKTNIGADSEFAIQQAGIFVAWLEHGE